MNMKKIYYLLFTTIILMTCFGCSDKKPTNAYIKSITISNLPEKYLTYNSEKVQFRLVCFQEYFGNYNYDDELFYDQQLYDIDNCPTSITFDAHIPIDMLEKTYFVFKVLTTYGANTFYEDHFNINSVIYEDFIKEVEVETLSGFEVSVKFEYE